MVIGSSWVQLDKVNLSPFPTHSARDSDLFEEELCLKAVFGCVKETELIWGKFLEREFSQLNSSLVTFIQRCTININYPSVFFFYHILVTSQESHFTVSLSYCFYYFSCKFDYKTPLSIDLCVIPSNLLCFSREFLETMTFITWFVVD